MTPRGQPTFLVLTVLVAEPKHGYAVIEDVQRITDGRATSRAGTLYAVLDRLRSEGLIEVDHEEVVQSRMRATTGSPHSASGDWPTKAPDRANSSGRSCGYPYGGVHSGGCAAQPVGTAEYAGHAGPARRERRLHG